MTVTGGGGYPDVTALDLGYDNTIDVGRQMPPARFVKAAELVTGGVGNLSTLTGLIYFLADHTALNSSLDFTGMAALQFIQCYSTSITGVTLTGCTALIRLQVEASNLTALDLNPVAANLTDLRAAIQAGGALTFATLTSPMAVEYHYCTRDQTVTNSIPLSRLPAIFEYWTWNTGLTGKLAPQSSALLDVESHHNKWTSADVTGQYPAGRGGTLNLNHCNLTAVTLDACPGLSTADLSFNLMNRPAVDTVLTVMNGFGTSNGTLNLLGNTAPSAAGTAASASLAGRGWTVTTDAYPYRLMDGLHGRPGVGSSGEQPPNANFDSNNLTFGILFHVTQDNLQLQGYWFWRTDAGQPASCSFALWKMTGHGTGTYLGSATYVQASGMTAAAFNYTALPSPYPLASGVTYMAVCGNNGFHPITVTAFGSNGQYPGGIQSGPVNAYSAPTGTAADPWSNPQCSFTSGGSDPRTQLPVNANQDMNVWVDVQVGAVFPAGGAPDRHHCRAPAGRAGQARPGGRGGHR